MLRIHQHKVVLGANVIECRWKLWSLSVQLLFNHLCGLQRFKYTEYNNFTKRKILSLYLSHASMRLNSSITLVINLIYSYYRALVNQHLQWLIPMKLCKLYSNTGYWCKFMLLAKMFALFDCFSIYLLSQAYKTWRHSIWTNKQCILDRILSCFQFCCCANTVIPIIISVN